MYAAFYAVMMFGSAFHAIHNLLVIPLTNQECVQ